MSRWNSRDQALKWVAVWAKDAWKAIRRVKSSLSVIETFIASPIERASKELMKTRDSNKEQHGFSWSQREIDLRWISQKGV